MSSFIHNKYRRLVYLVHGIFVFCPQLKNWWLFILDVGVLKRGHLYTFLYKNGLKIQFRARTSDGIINEEVFGEKSYEAPFSGDTSRLRRCIDLGAQTGVFTLYALSKAKNIQVVSVEATKDNFELLQKNVEGNNFSSRVELHQKAAWSASGETVTIHMSTRNTGGHSVVKDTDEFVGSESVSTISLADLVGTEYCDILKTDIEGAEHEVLLTADADTLSRIGCIVGEVHGDKEKKTKLMEFLREHGFTVSTNGDVFLAKRVVA